MTYSFKWVKAALCLIVVFLLSCSREDNKTVIVKTFPLHQELDTLMTIIPANAEFGTNSIGYAGNYLVMLNRGADYCFSVYDDEFNLVDTLIRKGQGPNELLSPMYFGQWFGNPMNPEIYVVENSTSQLLQCSLLNFDKLDKILVLPSSEYLSPSRLFALTDSVYVGISLPIGLQSCLFKYNASTLEVTKAPSFVPFGGNEAFYTSQCGLAFMNSQERFAITYLYFPIICIVDEDFNLVKKIFINDEIDTESLKLSDEVGGFSFPSFVGDKLVALRINYDESAENELMVFSKDGEPLAAFGVGRSLSFAICPDKERMVMLVYDKELDVVKFAIYQLPEILK